VERQTRFVMIAKIANRDTHSVRPDTLISPGWS